jgi:hypothetical protein
MANPQQTKENDKDKSSPTPKQFINFAQFFKGYMNVSSIVVAALPIAFNQLGVIPGFETNNKRDYYLRLESAIQAIKQKETNGLTFEKLLNNIENLKNEKEETTKENLKIIIVHLLKWNYQPEKRCQAWINLINEHRQRLYDEFETSPSLEDFCKEFFPEAYKEAYKLAVKEIDLSIIHFMNEDECPFSYEQTLTNDWYEFTNK